MAFLNLMTLPSGTKDGNENKPATFKHTYIFGTTIYINRKDLQFSGETKLVNRHEYSYKKKPRR